MFLSFQDQRDFRQYCDFGPKTQFWARFISMESNHDDYNDGLYQRIESDMVEWVKKNTKAKVFYNGDLDFEFESKEERDAFDEEFGDPLAFKLRFS